MAGITRWSALCLVSLFFCFSVYGAEDPQLTFERVVERDDEFGLLYTLEVLLVNNIPSVAIFTVKNIRNNAVKIYGPLSSTDFSNNIRIMQAGRSWRNIAPIGIEYPRVEPGEIYPPIPQSQELAPGDSISWRYQLDELIDDYEAFSTQDNFYRLGIMTVMNFSFSSPSASYEDSRTNMVSLRWVERTEP